MVSDAKADQLRFDRDEAQHHAVEDGTEQQMGQRGQHDGPVAGEQRQLTPDVALCMLAQRRDIGQEERRQEESRQGNRHHRIKAALHAQTAR